MIDEGNVYSNSDHDIRIVQIKLRPGQEEVGISLEKPVTRILDGELSINFTSKKRGCLEGHRVIMRLGAGVPNCLDK